jgi:hypothetical protein
LDWLGLQGGADVAQPVVAWIDLAIDQVDLFSMSCRAHSLTAALQDRAKVHNQAFWS